MGLKSCHYLESRVSNKWSSVFKCTLSLSLFFSSTNSLSLSFSLSLNFSLYYSLCLSLSNFFLTLYFFLSLSLYLSPSLLNLSLSHSFSSFIPSFYFSCFFLTASKVRKAFVNTRALEGIPTFWF